MAVLGWLGTGAGGFPVQFFEWNLPGILSKNKELGEVLMELHGICGWVILIVVLAHIGGALKHWLVNRDGVMARMGFF
jgi:cytochrome b561